MTDRNPGGSTDADEYNQRDEQPGPDRTLTTKDVFELFLGQPDRREPLTAPEVAEQVNVSRPTAYNRLQELVDEGRLRTKEVGARGRVYWLPENHVES